MNSIPPSGWEIQNQDQTKLNLIAHGWGKLWVVGAKPYLNSTTTKKKQKQKSKQKKNKTKKLTKTTKTNKTKQKKIE
jgi:hypothetical protein